MIYEGKALRVQALEGQVLELTFDLGDSRINKFDAQTLEELPQALAAIKAVEDPRGLLISSAKDSFMVGADIHMFGQAFAKADEDLVAMNQEVHQWFSMLEALPCATVAAISGQALGGGLEFCLAADYRVVDTSARLGLPEVKLGIFPGWGGTVRLPRLIGADNAIEWICAGEEKDASTALAQGVADALVAPEQLRAAALELLADAQAGRFDYQARRQEKAAPLQLGQLDLTLALETAKGYVAAKAGPHYPAPVAAIKTLQKHASLPLAKALELEAREFVKVAKTSVCRNLVSLFVNDQSIKKRAGGYASQARPVQRAAVLGAGIMGGGIACQSAVKGTPVLMKDVAEEGLDAGLEEAARLLEKRVSRGRLDTSGLAAALNRIVPTLSYGDFGNRDLVVEAVVENPKVKARVLQEVEAAVGPECILTSNTSTISISQLAESLERPENFCGMHFFNPVHRMPLVEVIRGARSSDTAIATTVAYAQALGKTPIVVNDCPGFLVNRVLFPYFAGFIALVRDGVEVSRIDRTMEGFGWPMGPAWLLDVVGLDTAVHARQVMAVGYPDRMADEQPSIIEKLVEAGRLGQKNGGGFYDYQQDAKGRSRKVPSEAAARLIQADARRAMAGAGEDSITDEDIVARMMLPLCLESVRCLEEGVVASAAEVDMGLVYGIGFPPFRGGALRYIDEMGAAAVCDLADRCRDLGPLYAPTAELRRMASQNQRFYD